jgi:hypothetical protein
LCHPSGAVHDIGAYLANTMEMEACGLRLELVGKRHNHRISYGGLDGRTWPLTVDSDYLPRKAVWRCSDPSDVPIISHSCGESERRRRENSDYGFEHIGYGTSLNYRLRSTSAQYGMNLLARNKNERQDNFHNQGKGMKKPARPRWLKRTFL